MKKFIISILIASGVIYLSMSVLWIRSHGWNRPYISWDIRELASYLAEHDLSPRGCLNLVWFEIGLSQTEARAECVYNYAKLTKDPSACELLMPSDYGWDCLGQAEKPNSRQCWFDFGPTPPQVGHGNDFVTLPECASSPQSMQQNRCCELAETLYVNKINNCDALREPTMLHDQCLELMAKRDRNLVLCGQIEDENVRSGCEVAVRALQKE